MKTNYITMIGCVLAMNALCAQEDGQAPPPHQPGPENGQGRHRPMHPPIMVALDADRDGKISAEEIKNAAEALAALDHNGDGELTPPELFGPPPQGMKPHGDGQGGQGQGRPQGPPPQGKRPQGPPPQGDRPQGPPPHRPDGQGGAR